MDMDNHQLDTIKLMQSCKDIEALWENLKSGLAKNGVTSIFYGFVYSGTFFKKAHGIESGWFKTNHPPEYLKYFGREFNMEDDPTAIHCINETTPFFWHDTRQLKGITERQLKFMRKSAEYGMEVGVTLPFHFNKNGVGGMGLCMANTTPNYFDSLWESKGDEISSIARSFDELARNNHMRSIFNLLENELKALISLSWSITQSDCL